MLNVNKGLFSWCNHIPKSISIFAAGSLQVFDIFPPSLKIQFLIAIRNWFIINVYSTNSLFFGVFLLWQDLFDIRWSVNQWPPFIDWGSLRDTYGPWVCSAPGTSTWSHSWRAGCRSCSVCSSYSSAPCWLSGARGFWRVQSLAASPTGCLLVLLYLK